MVIKTKRNLVHQKIGLQFIYFLWFSNNINFTNKYNIVFFRKGKVKTPSSIPSAEEEQLSTLDGECTENKRNLIKEIWNNEPSLSNSQLENDTQSGMYF